MPKTVVCPRFSLAALLALLLGGCATFDGSDSTVISSSETPTLIADVPFVWSENEVVEAMLKLGGVGPQDLVYDLGCGDGRIVIAAAAKYGARGVGIDIDPAPLRFAVAGAKRAGVAARVRFVRGNMFEADLRPATVVTLYLSESVNRRLLPKLLRELAPGTRIVSHKFTFGDAWPPERTVGVEGESIYFWSVPPRASGSAINPR